MARWWQDSDLLNRMRQIAERQAQQGVRLNLEQLLPQERNAAPVRREQAGIAPEERQTWRPMLPTLVRTDSGSRPAAEAERQIRQGWLPATEDFFRDTREAWKEVVTPTPSATRLPDAWAAAVEREQERAATPDVAPLGFAQPQTVAENVQRLGDVARLAGAAWHDVKQVPWLGVLPRVAEATARTGMGLLQVPGNLTENLLATASMHKLAAAPPVNTSGRSWMGLDQYVKQPEGIEGIAPGTTVRDVLISEGNTPERVDEAMWEAGRMWFSGPQATLRTARRILAGEDGRQAAQGYTLNMAEPTDADYSALTRYLTSVQVTAGRTGQDAPTALQAALAQVQETGQIPGEMDIWREMAGQILLDPTNVADVVRGTGRVAQGISRAAQRLRQGAVVADVPAAAARAADVAADAAKAAGAVEAGAAIQRIAPQGAIQQAGEQIARTPPPIPSVAAAEPIGAAGLAPATRIPTQTGDAIGQIAAQGQDAIPQAAVQAAAEAATPPQARGWLRQMWDRINPAALTDEARVRRAADETAVLVGTLTNEAQTGAEAASTIRRLVQDPQSLSPVIGAAAQWAGTQRARSVLARVADQLDALPSVQAKVYNPVHFLSDLDGAITKAFAQEVPSSGRLVDAYRTWSQGFKSLMSEFYLRTPGYVVRNTTGDVVTMAYDGINTFDNWDTVSGFYGRFGPTTPRVADALRGGITGTQALQAGKTSVLGQLTQSVLGQKIGDVVSGLSNQMGEVVSKGTILGKRTILGEETRYARGFYAALKRALGQVWSPTIPAEIAEQLGPMRTRALEQALRTTYTTQERIDAARSLLGNPGPLGLVDWRALLGEDLDSVSVEVLRRLDEQTRTAGSLDEVLAAISGVEKQLDLDLGETLSGAPLPSVRRMWTDAEAAQDAAEAAASSTRLAAAAGVDDATAADAAAEMFALRQSLDATEAQAEAMLMQDAIAAIERQGVSQGDALELMRQVRVDTNATKATARGLADEVNRATWAAVTEAKRAGEGPQTRALVDRLWQENRAQVAAIWRKQNAEAMTLLDDAAQRLAEGRLVRRPDLVQEQVARYRAVLEELSQRQARRLRVEDIDDATKAFGEMLEGNRLTVDLAQQEAWRTALVNPSRDALDLAAQAEDDAQKIGAVTAAEVEAARLAWQQKRMEYKEFALFQNQKWLESFRRQANRYDTLRRDLLRLPIGETARQTFLLELGWPEAAARSLNPETASVVLRDKVRWDPVLQGPVTALEQIEEWTLGKVASDLGLGDDPARYTAREWDAVARAAERKAELWRRLADPARAYVYTNDDARAGLAVADAIRQQIAIDPAYAQRMLAGSERLSDVAMTAKTRAELMYEAGEISRTIARIPEGATHVQGRKAGSLYVVELLGGGQVMERAAFENPADALREARRLQDALWRGEGLPAAYLPLTLEDAAKAFGVGETEADWQRLADIAEARGDEILHNADEYARQIKVAQEAGLTRADTPTTMPDWRTGEYREVYTREGRMSRAQRTAREREIAKDARSMTHEVVGDVLRRAGLTPQEVDALSLEQRTKLLREIGSGDLLTRKSGEAATIDGLSPERRARILAAAQGQAGLQRFAAVMGNVDDLHTAPGYAWLEIAQQAQQRADEILLRGAGFTDADLAQAAADPQTWAILVDQTRAASAIDVGQVPDVFDFESIEPIPFGNEIDEAATRLLAAGEDPDTVDALATAARADGESQKLLTAWAEQAGGPTPQEREELEALAAGAVQPPTLGEMASLEAERQKRLLQRARTTLQQQWDNIAQLRQQRTAPWVERRLDTWLRTDLDRHWRQIRPVAVETAREMADVALLDYSQRRRFDTWLALVTPYHYWQTRSARNWAARLAQRPGILASYTRVRSALQRENERKGYRQRFSGAIEIPIQTPGWMGGSVFIDPGQILFPFATFEPEDYSDPAEARNMVDYLYRTMQRYGFKPYGFLEMGLTKAGVIGDPQAPGEAQGWQSLLSGTPQARMVQAVRAATRRPEEGPVPGWFQRQPELKAWDSYRIARQLSNAMAAGETPVMDGLLAQEIMRRIATGELTPGVVRPDPSAADAANLARIAQAAGWSPEDVARAMERLRGAWLRAQQEQAVPALTGGLAGVTARIYPQGERQAVEMAREGRAQAYNKLTRMGSREAYETFRDAHPELYGRSATGAFIPGELTPDADWTPADARATLAYRQTRDAAQAQMAVNQMAALAEQGIADADLRTVRGTTAEELEAERTRLFGAARATGGDAIGTQEAWTPLYGSTPAEAREQAREAAMQAVSDAYRMLETDAEKRAFWLAMKRGDLAGAGVALPDGLTQIAPQAGQVTEEQLRDYWRENDTLAEALQSAYREWYAGQWEAYRQAAGPDVSDRLPRSVREERYAQRDAAWQRFVEEGNAPTRPEMIRRVMALYGDRFTREEIDAAARSLRMPTMREVWMARMTPEEKRAYEEREALNTEREAFWDVYKALPERVEWRETKGHPLVALIVSKQSRPTATAEQYAQAAAVLRAWLEENAPERLQLLGRGRSSSSGGESPNRTPRPPAQGAKKATARPRYSGGGWSSRAGGQTNWQSGDGADWARLARVMSGSLRRLLSAYYLRGQALEPGALAELQRVMAALGFGGSVEEFLGKLRDAFQTRTGNPAAPRRKWSSK